MSNKSLALSTTSERHVEMKNLEQKSPRFLEMDELVIRKMESRIFRKFDMVVVPLALICYFLAFLVSRMLRFVDIR